MKKRTIRIIILSVIAVIVIAMLVMAYNIWQTVGIAEDLTGQLTDVPQVSESEQVIHISNGDWPNWRGPAHNGKSTVSGIRKLWEVNYLLRFNVML